MQEENVNRNKKAVFGWTMYDWANSVYSLAITTAIFPTYYSAVSKSKELMIRMDNNMSIVPFLGFEVPSVSLYSYAISVAYILIVVLSPILGAIADYSGSKKKFMFAFCSLGSLSCSGCAVGSYQDQTGQQKCSQCPLGRYFPNTTAVECIKCAPGKFAMSLGLQQCQDCQTGSYTTYAGAQSCDPCPVGTYNDQTGQTFCKNCTAGE